MKRVKELIVVDIDKTHHEVVEQVGLGEHSVILHVPAHVFAGELQELVYLGGIRLKVVPVKERHDLLKLLLFNLLDDTRNIGKVSVKCASAYICLADDVRDGYLAKLLFMKQLC